MRLPQSVFVKCNNKRKYCLRACIVNFRTSEKDINQVIEIIADEGRRIHEELRAAVRER
jgi:hypothetical protein